MVELYIVISDMFAPNKIYVFIKLHLTSRRGVLLMFQVISLHQCQTQVPWLQQHGTVQLHQLSRIITNLHEVLARTSFLDIPSAGE